MNNLYLRIIEQIQDDIFEEGAATTMDAVSYLPSQVGVVTAAMKKLKGKKDRWNLEILEGEEEYTVTFEDKLKITVPNEHWDEFQEVFEGGHIDNGCYLNLQTKLMDSVELSMETILEDRKEEFSSKIQELYYGIEIQTAAKVVEKVIGVLGCKENFSGNMEAVVPLIDIEEHLEKTTNNLLEDHDDLGFIEILIENTKVPTEGNCLAGARFKALLENVELIFEATVPFEKDCSFSLAINDGEVADRLEEYCVGIPRIANTFYPAVGQVLSTQGILESLKEVIVDIQEDNEGENEDE